MIMTMIMMMIMTMMMTLTMMMMNLMMMVFLYSANPTYGNGTDNILMLRAAGDVTGNAGQGKKDFSAKQQDTYEAIEYEAVDKRVS